MLNRITDRKIPCVYTHVYRITKNWVLAPYNSLHHADNRRYFSGLSPTPNRRESAHVLLGEGSGEIWKCPCWEKGNFIMINEFKYGQTWKIWPSPLSLSLYNPFKGQVVKKKKINLLALEFFDQSKLPLKVGLSPSKNNYFYLIQC